MCTIKNDECYCKYEALFLHLKVLFNHAVPLSKAQKPCIDSLKTLSTKTNMGTETDLANTRNNAAATTATSIPKNKH